MIRILEAQQVLVHQGVGNQWKGIPSALFDLCPLFPQEYQKHQQVRLVLVGQDLQDVRLPLSILSVLHHL